MIGADGKQLTSRARWCTGNVLASTGVAKTGGLWAGCVVPNRRRKTSARKVRIKWLGDCRVGVATCEVEQAHQALTQMFDLFNSV